MKYNTISTSTVGGEGRKSTLTLYTDPDFVHSDKVSTRGELEIVQRALKLQTRRCRQLVAEYTRRLQEKEHQYQSEKLLRDNQLAKVIRTLLIFEARLKQEQKFIRHQLEEKDYIIKKQRDDINKLSNQFCKHCNQYYSPVLLDDSSSEYVATDYQDYQSSNFDSSSETYTTLSDYVKPPQKEEQSLFIKNKSKAQGKHVTKKIGHRKSVGTYFEVLKLRNDNPSLSSNDDNTSNDYENLESLPPEITSSNINLTEDNLGKHDNQFIQIQSDDANSEDLKISKITESIPVFEGDGETNDNWYASASDQEDDDQRDIYRNNPVLECMNQILMQNINDTLVSPPKTPTVDRRSLKNKRVKFSDEEEAKENVLNAENLEKKSSTANYYETPIQKAPNFYETPQSIYSNDYEQILSKCNETFVPKPKKENHYYVDMDTKSEIENEIRKTKIVRTPPAVPPKPANLLSKYKLGVKSPSKATPSIDSDPDYCSISELNLPTHKISKKLNVVAEINIPNDTNTEKHIILHSPKQDASHYDLDTSSELITPKAVVSQSPTKPKPKEPEIPKLPQVSEILIPDENDTKKEERIAQDNYIKNNSQILKLKNRHEKRSILIGTSVSNLITSFNNQQLLSEIQSKPRVKPHKKLFSSFECLQNLEKQPAPKRNSDSYSFDLSQNFEEFKLDDCEIEEYVSEEIPNEEHVLPDIISSPKLTSSTRVELVRAINDSIPPTNKMQQLKKKLELEKKEIYNQATMKGDNEPTYEHFLECTGLSSKSILTPSRLLSNHKSVLKPKDVKLRSKVKANGLERQGSTIKYWSEPYI